MGRPKGSKNKAKDSAPQIAKDMPKVSVPKYLRGKEAKAPEPDTYLCKGPETAIVDKDKESRMGKCKACGVFNSNSEVDHLCLNCHKEAAGFEFDEEKNRFVKKNKGRK